LPPFDSSSGAIVQSESDPIVGRKLSATYRRSERREADTSVRLANTCGRLGESNHQHIEHRKSQYHHY
jgi:hypothetical protein